MYRSYLIGATLAAALAFAPIAGWACGMPGNKTHVGQLMAVDTNSKSFTIFDVETASPITFISDDTILKTLESIRGMIQVKYEHVGDALRAVDVRY